MVLFGGRFLTLPRGLGLLALPVVFALDFFLVLLGLGIAAARIEIALLEGEETVPQDALLEVDQPLRVECIALAFMILKKCLQDR